jgi:hypothetical protein
MKKLGFLVGCLALVTATLLPAPASASDPCSLYCQFSWERCDAQGMACGQVCNAWGCTCGCIP